MKTSILRAKNNKSLKSLSIVVPVYYRKKSLLKDVRDKYRALSKFLKTSQFEIIYVFDGIDVKNRSNNPQILENFIKEHKIRNIHIIARNKNMGKGYSVIEGMKYASGEIIGFMDFGNDIAYEILPRMYREISENKQLDAILPNKYHRDSAVNTSLLRKIYSYGYTFIAFLFTGSLAPDSQTGCKMFRKDALHKVIGRLLVKRFAFDIELLTALKDNGFRNWRFIPVKLKLRGDTSIKRSDIVNMFVDTLAIGYRSRILRWYNEDEKNLSLKINS